MIFIVLVKTLHVLDKKSWFFSKTKDELICLVYINRIHIEKVDLC